MSDTRDDMLYEVCPACSGTGVLGYTVIHRGTGPVEKHVTCPNCKPLRVVAVGVTTWALDRMARREIIEAEQRAGFDRTTGALAPAAKSNKGEK